MRFFFWTLKIELSKGKIFLKKSTFLWIFTDWYIHSKTWKKSFFFVTWEWSKERYMWFFFKKFQFFGRPKINSEQDLGGGFYGSVKNGLSMGKSFFEGPFLPKKIIKVGISTKMSKKSFFLMGDFKKTDMSLGVK